MSMKGYVSKEILFQEMSKYGWKHSDSTIHEFVEDLPNADVEEVRHEEWRESGSGYNWKYVCSGCGYIDGYPFNERLSNCPNCYAKMDGKGNNGGYTV